MSFKQPNRRRESERESAEICADKLKALSEPIRLRIIDRLRDGPTTVSDMARHLEIDLMLASHHLRVLRAAGFVERRQNGRFAVYALRPGVAGRGQINLGCCQLRLPRSTD
jgi:DNA-binding transcriptional ArsR family regulator